MKYVSDPFLMTAQLSQELQLGRRTWIQNAAERRLTDARQKQEKLEDMFGFGNLELAFEGRQRKWRRGP